jgi:glycosyltransferase involved in cell wall biosynthesis
MRISVITVCFNSEKNIRTAIESVLAQKNVDLEYIIIDGESTDGTVDVIKEYAEKYPSVIKWISEPDAGIYDAMNKGIDMAVGDIIGILNSDDFYASNNVLATICDKMMDNNVDSCYGDIVFIKNNKPYRYWKAGKQKTFKIGWMPPHPTFFVKKHIYDKYGLYRLDCGVNADYELLLRFLYVKKISSICIKKVLVNMRMGGSSNKDIQARLNGFKNDKTAWHLNDIKPWIFTLFLKRIMKLPQYFCSRFHHI